MVKSAALTLCAFVFLALYLLLIPVQKVHAATIKVDRDCSLGDAIQSANNNQSEGECTAGDGTEDTIILTRDARPKRGIPKITSKIVFEGNNYNISLDNDYHVFDIRSGDLTIKNLTVTYRGQRKDRVIAVWNGKLTIIDSKIRNCEVGIKVSDSAAAILGETVICDLPADKILMGSYTGSVDIVVPRQNTCGTLPGTTAAVSATMGLYSGVQCQQVDAGGIGIQSVIEAGFIDAVDVWGYVEQGVEICFPQSGSITFLDATTMPRRVVSLSPRRTGNMTCVSLDRPGTVVLVPLQSAAGEAAPVPAQQNCSVTTTGNLNLREAPSMDDDIIGYVPRGATLDAISRTTYWVNVEYHGRSGWIGAKYVQTAGPCE